MTTGLEALVKRADIKTKLQPHQQRVVDKMKKKDQRGLVVAHGLGTGKTLTALAVEQALGMPADVVVPASLRGNFEKEIEKHTSGDFPKTQIHSLQNLALKGHAPKNPLFVLDEAHRARTPGSKIQKVLNDSDAEKRLLLTGSPMYNTPGDISPLINFVAGEHVLPDTPLGFSQRYIGGKQVYPGLIDAIKGMKPGIVPVVNPAHRAELENIFSKYVDYQPQGTEGFPDVKYHDFSVPMSPGQTKIYDAFLAHNAPASLRQKITSRVAPSADEAKQLNAFLTRTRQISNTTGPFSSEEAQSPKIDRAFEELQKNFAHNPHSKAVVYSNFLGAGLDPYKKKLEDAKIPYGEFTGEQGRAEREQLVRDFNNNKLKALLLSAAGGEGVDLRGVRLTQLLDPAWAEERNKQVIGRAARFHSHDDLPENERNVEVQRYYATRPREGLLQKMRLQAPGGSVDEYLQSRADEKERLISQFRDIMAKQSQ